MLKPGWHDALRNVNVSEVDAVCRAPEGAHWLCGRLRHKSLLIRQCCLDIFEEAGARIQASQAIEQKGVTGLIALGSPGIGKSCLLNYLLARLHQQGKNARVELGERDCGHLFKGKERLFYEKQGRSLPEEVIDDEEAIHLFDPRKIDGRGPAACGPLCIAASSPRKSNWQQPEAAFQALSTPSRNEDAASSCWVALPSRLRAPVWSAEEIRAHLLQAPQELRNIDTKDIGLLHDAHGGIPRRLRCSGRAPASLDAERKALQRAASSIDLPSALESIHLGAPPTNQAQQKLTHQIFCVTAPKKGEKLDYRVCGAGHAPKVAEEEMSSAIRKMTRGERCLLRAGVAAKAGDAGGCRGNLLQKMRHEGAPKLLASGITIERSRFKPRKELRAKILRLPLEPNGLSIEPDVYCEASQNFPPIDGLLMLRSAHCAFQRAARNHHDLKVDEQGKIISCLPDCKELRLAWAHDLRLGKHSVGPCKGQDKEAFEVTRKVVTMWRHRLITEPGRSERKTLHIHPLEKEISPQE